MRKLTALALAVLCIALGAQATQYSKLAIITAAKQHGRWDALKAWIQQAGLYDEWLVCSYLSDEFPQYAQITNSIVSAGVATADELSAIIIASKDSALPDTLLNARYDRDMKSETGRTAWHGKMLKQIVDTNALTHVTVYEDGYELKSRWTAPKSSAASYNARLPKPPMTNGIPVALAKARMRAYENKTAVSNVTVNVTVGGTGGGK